ncbi:hypothetical protein PPIS_b1002 [Pseudoalteromonas piscicida]|uniref:Lipoprotein n=1 Tax=Pseudoalteromonas piscicida TaxID=43662 RepID=A0ABN5CKA4_PSEO7|nr:hypothetical protein PPIS_b1002 [Pseudoalteromonas piscicida]
MKVFYFYLGEFFGVLLVMECNSFYSKKLAYFSYKNKKEK